MGPETIGVSGTEFGRIGRTEANNGDRKCLERKRVNYTNGLLGGRGVRRSAFAHIPTANRAPYPLLSIQYLMFSPIIAVSSHSM